MVIGVSALRPLFDLRALEVDIGYPTETMLLSIRFNITSILHSIDGDAERKRHSYAEFVKLKLLAFTKCASRSNGRIHAVD